MAEVMQGPGGRPVEDELEPSDLAMDPEEVQARLERLSELEGFAPVVEQLQQQGFADAAGVQRQLQFQQELASREQMLFGAYQAQVDQGTISPEQAQALFEHEVGLMQRELAAEILLRQYGEAQADAEILAALDAFPDTLRAAGPDGHGLVKLLHQSTGAPVGDVAQYVHQLLAQHGSRAVTAYAGQQGGLGGIPFAKGMGPGVPGMPAGAGVPPGAVAPPAVAVVPQAPGGGIVPQAGRRGTDRSSWADLLGLGR